MVTVIQNSKVEITSFLSIIINGDGSLNNSKNEKKKKKIHIVVIFVLFCLNFKQYVAFFYFPIIQRWRSISPEGINQ